MSLRTLGHCVTAAALAAALSQSTRADDSRPSEQTLAAMGLSSMTVVSDEQAMNVRGHGFMGGGSSAVAFGNSFATFNTPFGTSHSENGYAAEGRKFAAGDNYSEAGVELRITRSRGGIFGKSGGGMTGGNAWRGKPGGNMGGHPGGAGRTTSFSVRVFAGGFSSAWAH